MNSTNKNYDEKIKDYKKQRKFINYSVSPLHSHENETDDFIYNFELLSDSLYNPWKLKKNILNFGNSSKQSIVLIIGGIDKGKNFISSELLSKNNNKFYKKYMNFGFYPTDQIEENFFNSIFICSLSFENPKLLNESKYLVYIIR